jgi:hypothetical protein
MAIAAFFFDSLMIPRLIYPCQGCNGSSLRARVTAARFSNLNICELSSDEAQIIGAEIPLAESSPSNTRASRGRGGIGGRFLICPQVVGAINV